MFNFPFPDFKVFSTSMLQKIALGSPNNSKKPVIVDGGQIGELTYRAALIIHDRFTAEQCIKFADDFRLRYGISPQLYSICPSYSDSDFYGNIYSSLQEKIRCFERQNGLDSSFLWVNVSDQFGNSGQKIGWFTLRTLRPEYYLQILADLNLTNNKQDLEGIQELVGKPVLGPIEQLLNEEFNQERFCVKDKSLFNIVNFAPLDNCKNLVSFLPEELSQFAFDVPIGKSELPLVLIRNYFNSKYLANMCFRPANSEKYKDNTYTGYVSTGCKSPEEILELEKLKNGVSLPNILKESFSNELSNNDLLISRMDKNEGWDENLIGIANTTVFPKRFRWTLLRKSILESERFTSPYYNDSDGEIIFASIPQTNFSSDSQAYNTIKNFGKETPFNFANFPNVYFPFRLIPVYLMFKELFKSNDNDGIIRLSNQLIIV